MTALFLLFNWTVVNINHGQRINLSRVISLASSPVLHSSRIVGKLWDFIYFISFGENKDGKGADVTGICYPSDSCSPYVVSICFIFNLPVFFLLSPHLLQVPLQALVLAAAYMPIHKFSICF